MTGTVVGLASAGLSVGLLLWAILDDRASSGLPLVGMALALLLVAVLLLDPNRARL